MKSITIGLVVAAAAAGASALVHPWTGCAAAAFAAAIVARQLSTRAAEVLAQRDRHLAQTAHELRTPLTSVLSALELVREGHATTAAEIAEFLEEADLAAQHLAHLVNDLLDDQALREGRLHLDRRRHAVATLLTDAHRLLAPTAARRGIGLQFPAATTGLDVDTDHRRCQQVLLNLVVNAVKFSPPGAAVEVRVTATPDRVRFAVVDRGPGVPEPARRVLFTAFGQAPSDRRAEGTGLGLFITRRLLAQLGGQLGYEPGDGGGSVFWFELPRAPAARPQRSIAPPPAATR